MVNACIWATPSGHLRNRGFFLYNHFLSFKEVIVEGGKKRALRRHSFQNHPPEDKPGGTLCSLG
jgi:hypothetical protein